MNKTLKKTLSIMLSILMIVTTMPMAFAADGHTHALSADGETVEFTELPADATRIDTAGNYYLTQDIELTNNLWIEVEGTVNLCLNGHSITAVEDSSNKTVVFLYGGTLNLCDCKGGGCITSAEDLTFSGVRALGDTEFNMYSGEIKNNYYYAVQGGNFNMYGGKLSGNKKTAVYVTDSFNMYGGEISGNSKSAIEGVAVEVYAGNFNMYGGEIKNNENISSYINASIVGVNGGATFTMYDGKICDNEGPAVYSGGTFIMNGGEISGNSGYSSGVSVGTGGIFTMNGGAIKNNTASGRGGGVYINERASFNMNGGEISGNTAEQGGGVFSTYDSAKINLKKGVITGNSATYAGGVGAQYANTPVEISGADVQIINNTATTYPDLRVNAPVTVSAPLDSAKTKISLSVNGYIIAKPDGTNLTTLKGMEDCFIQPYENLLVVCNSDGELEAIEWSASIAEKDGDLVVNAPNNDSVTYQWYEVNGEELTELEGETSVKLTADKIVLGKTYACKVYLEGEEMELLTIKCSYAITHQPTEKEPYVELNDDTDASYQWYTVEDGITEVTDENADTVAYDWGESSYDKETGWTGVPYEEDYNGQDFFTVELKAGETITVEVTGDFIDGVGLWDYDTENGAWVDSEEDVTSYELTVESEGNYTFYTYVNSGVVTVKAYKTAVEKTAIEGETSAELKNPEFGKKYVCEVTYGNGETEVSDAFEYTYAITHQPTEAEPYVELNDDTAASYQWYTVEGDGYEVTNENAFGDWQSIGFPISSTVYEDGKWIADDSMGMQYYFMVELEAGDTINFEFASEVEQIIFALDGNADEGIAVGGTECSVTVEESGAYWLITPPVDYVCADVGNIAYNAIEGETAAVLNPTALGKYACEVTFADGTTEMSDSFLVTTLHTCDFTGEWKYDADKHWKECTADGCSKISEEAEHSFTDSKCDCGYTCPHSSYTDGVCDNCEYACPHDSYTYTDNGDGTHDATCTACGAVVDNDAHTIENHVCTACGAMEIVVSFDAGDYEWKTGDTLYFCRVSRENEWEEYCFTATVAEDGTVTWTPDKTLYWDGTGEHKLVVRYPEWPGLAWDNWGVGADQTTSEKLRENDLMKAIWSGIPTTDTITLNLKHRLAKVSVNYEIAEDVAATVSKAEIYSLTQYLFFDTNTLDRVDVDWTKDYNLWINSYHTDNQFTAFVSPDAYAADGNFIKITLDNGTVYEVKMNKAVTFAEGAEYTYKVVITADGAYLTCADECTFEYTDNGDGTHNKVCSDCGDVIVNNENHTLTYTANGNTITATCSANCGYSGTATIGVEGKTYDGNAVEVVVSKTGSLENTIIPVTLTKDGEAFTGEPVNAGTYTASIGMGENENAVVASVEFIIEKANPVIAAAPTPNTLTYIGEAQYLISAGEAVGGTMVYSLTENGEYTTSIPQGTNAGDYTVWYYVQGDANHNDSAKDSVPVTIKKAPLTVTASDATITYGEAPTNNGVTYSGFVNGENEGVLGGELAYTYTYTQNGNVGNYSITPEGLTADNYEITFVDGTLTVEQIDIGDIIDEMKINLEQYSYVYDGTEKKPKVTSITVDGVTLTEGTDYTVRYEDNVNVGEEATAVITFEGNYDGTFRKWFTITKAYYDLTAPTPNTLTYNGEEQYLVSAGTVEGADFEYSLDAVSWSTSIPQAKDVGNYTVYYRVLADENHYGIEGTVDVTIKECTHTWNEGVLTRPTFETAGYYTYTCTLCGHSYTEPTKKADDTALNDASMKVMEYIGNDTLTQEAANEIHNSYLDILKNNGNIFDEFGFVRGDLIEEDQPAIDAVTEALEKIIADADEKIASGEYVKADYTKIDEAIDDIEEKLASENVTDEGKAELEEIKKQLEEMKADENTSAADVAELEKALEDYEEELDKGIEDGTLVEVDVDAIADDVNKKWAEKLEAEGLLDEYEDFINNQKATDEAMATVDEINDFANSLEGTVAENAENIAKLNEMLDSLYSSFENCLRGTHNFKDYETTSPAKCGENAVETSTCWFCGETDEREVEGTALEHSFTKYEETEAPKCGVAGKEVAYCDNGCQTTDERETPALEHIFLDYVSNGDATCTADGTKTASCLNGCGTTDTVADEGSMIDHSDEDGDKLCDDCGEEVYDRCDICGGKAHGDDKIQLVFCMIITIIRIVTAILKSIY